MIRADELDDVNDRILLEAQRAATRDDWAAVAAAADEALKNDPMRAEAMYLAALALRKAGSDGMAALMLNLAAKLEPQRAPIWTQLAMCLHERHPKEAYQAALKAQKLKPDEPDTLSLLTNVSGTLGRHAEALEWAERSEKLHGFIGETMHNKSFALMALGRWAEGWKAFKPSLGQPARKVRNYHADRETPRWNPNKHEKAVVVIYGEQGIGDEIMYASMLDKAIEAAESKGSRVVIECNPRNADLFARSFGVKAYGYSERAEWPADECVTHRLEMGGLGEYFASEPFRRGGFLAVDPARAAASREWLRRASAEGNDGERAKQTVRGKSRGEADHSLDCGQQRRKVGLAWTGGSWETGRGRRSVPFELIAQLMRGQDATFVCLEYEDRKSDLELTPGVLNPHWATRKGADMDDLAALVSNLDLVISVQTSVVDLCGALGVPCWALCDEVPQWRYTGFFGDDTMGFYESVKVYRQAKWGEWAPVIQRVAQDLKAFTEARKPKPANNAANPYSGAWLSC